MDEQEVVRRTDAAIRAMFSIFGTAHDRGEARERNGLLLIDAGVPVAMFNNAFVTRPLPEPQRQLREATEFYDERGLPFCVRISEGLDPRSEDACAALGLPYSDTVPGMALTDLSGSGRDIEGLEIKTAKETAVFDDHVRLCQEIFEIPGDVATKLLSREVLTQDDMECYVGYVRGEAVGTAGLFVSGRVATVCNVTTLPSMRGRGIGEALTWHAVHRGRALGCVMSALQASEMGRPLYERMGFHTVSPLRTFHRPGV